MSTNVCWHLQMPELGPAIKQKTLARSEAEEQANVAALLSGSGESAIFAVSMDTHMNLRFDLL